MTALRRSYIVLIATGLLRALSAAAQGFSASGYAHQNVLIRDVLVIGGGSAGTYAAVRLNDMGHTVALVEHQSLLGGHAQTYIDPTTKTPVNYGVAYFYNDPIVTNYFARFNIPLTTVNLLASGIPTDFVDFTTGLPVAGYQPPNPGAAFNTWFAQLAQYPYLNPGINLPNPVPADLVLPFGQFVIKYNLQSFVSFASSFAQGLGNILLQPTLYVMKNINTEYLVGVLNGFLTTTTGNTATLYQAATTALGPNVLLSTKIIAMDRTLPRGGTAVVVQTPAGYKLILAKKVVFAVPPYLANLSGFDLSANETSLFSQFNGDGYYTSLVGNTGISDNVLVANTGAVTPYNLPSLPGIYDIAPTAVSGLKMITYGSTNVLPDASVQADIIAEIQRVQTGLGLAITTPTFAVYSSHSPFELTVPAAAISAGFYSKLYALQGQRNTFYTGAAFDTQDSSVLWQFTEALLPSITASL